MSGCGKQTDFCRLTLLSLKVRTVLSWFPNSAANPNFRRGICVPNLLIHYTKGNKKVSLAPENYKVKKIRKTFSVIEEQKFEQV
jgi:hypothetical protein